MRRFSFHQRIFIGFAMALFLVFLVGLGAYIGFKSSTAHAERVIHTQKVISQADHIVQLAIDADAENTWYIINGAKRSQDSVKSSNLLLPAINTLKKLVSDNPDEVRNVDSLNYHARKFLASEKALTYLLASKGPEIAKIEMLKDSGRIYQVKLRAAAEKIKSIEQAFLQDRLMDSYYSYLKTKWVIIIGSVLIFAVVLVLLSFIVKTFRQQKEVERNVVQANAQLDQLTKDQEEQNWILEGAVIIDSAMRKSETIEELAGAVIVETSKYLNADLGAMYIFNDDTGQLALEATYAFDAETAPKILNPQQGLIGQAVSQKRSIAFNNIPADYIQISSALGSSLPKTIFVHPIYLRDELKGIIELAFASDLPASTGKFFEKATNSISLGIHAGQNRRKTQRLIETTQQQAEELEAQQEELRTTNDELTQKTEELQASEEELRVQQEELKQINFELEEKARLLEERNHAVDEARQAIIAKAKELEQTSRYKSEFLANMSHELRTPLNSILVLARILRDNKAGNLEEEQIKYANVIHNAGSDLLTLINDILDLSKIESGKLDLTVENVAIEEIKSNIEALFQEVANYKKINFRCDVADDLPTTFVSDRMRIEQILKNLLSNAFKFTPENGSVSLSVSLASPGQNYFSDNLKSKVGEQVLAFSVKDSGIGIPEEKQKVIFEAFRQADGSTSRSYGGTGLGLSISRELSYILGGEIAVVSNPGEGSSFTLYLPIKFDGTEVSENGNIMLSDTTPSPVRQTISQETKVEPSVSHNKNTILIIEDDVHFAEVLKTYSAERGFIPLMAHAGDIGLELAKQKLPDAIILDIALPGLDGWQVLKRLKDDPKTKDIPVHLMSAGDERVLRAKQEGAIGFLKKPVDERSLDKAFDLLANNELVKLHKVLIVEDSEVQSHILQHQLAGKEVESRRAFTGAEAISLLEKELGFDCIILDLSLPDIYGLDLLDKIKEHKEWANIPVVINTAMELEQAELERVMKYTHAMVLKSNRSNDRLLDEVNLFMNKISAEENNGTARGQKPQSSGSQFSATAEAAFKGKIILIVDDDMRNIFALTSALQPYNLQVSIANNGVEALKKLDENPQTDLVLMDIMMPEMDGYEAMREIRKQHRFEQLPIIALTAKAMKADQEKCINAGANEYISKPVDVEKLVSLMRVWLS